MKKAVSHRLGYLIAVGVLFYATYGFSNWFSAQQENVAEIVFAWEEHIPFLAWTIVPYLVTQCHVCVGVLFGS